MLTRSAARLVPFSPAQYAPFRWVLHRAVQHGSLAPNAARLLLAHPEAPPPWDVYEALSQYAYPDRNTALVVISACAQSAAEEARRNRLPASSPQQSSTTYTVYPSANPVAARVTAEEGLELVARQILRCPRVGRDGVVLDALCRALLVGRQFELAASVFLAMDAVDVTHATWAGLLRAARLGNTAAVERLVSISHFPLSWVLTADAATELMLWGGPSGGRVKTRTAMLITRRYLAPRILAEADVPVPPNDVPLPGEPTPEIAAAVRAIEAWSSASEATPASLMARLEANSTTDTPSAKQPKRRRGPRVSRSAPVLTQRQWASGKEPLAPLSPVPIRVFFEISRQKVSVSENAVDTTALHWRIVWRTFQLLNRASPNWFENAEGNTSEDAEAMVFQMIDVLTRGASPWLAFNLAHHASRVGLADGVDIALYLLLRTHRGQYVEHGQQVAKLVFNWLLGTAEIYRRPERKGAVLNACRVLIQLGMQQELSQLYELVVENVFEFDAGYRAEVAQVLADVTCPSCNSMLPSNDPYIERACHVCGELVAPRPASERPSFEMSAEARERLRLRADANNRARSQELLEAAGRLKQQSSSKKESPPTRDTAKDTSSKRSYRPDLMMARPSDPAQVFREAVLAANSPSSSASSNVPVIWAGASGALAPEDIEILQGRSSSSVGSSDAAAEVPRFGDALVLDRSADRTAADEGAATGRVQLGPWSCCWCGERNDGLAARDVCSACKAYSGPTARWRRPVATADAKTGRVDPLDDFRARVEYIHSTGKSPAGSSNAQVSEDAAVGAGMHLLVYRRAFALRASAADGDYARVAGLVETLCRHRQRVLAAAVYFGVLPAAHRQCDRTLQALADAYGNFEESGVMVRAQPVLRNTRALVRVVLGEQICSKCYGAHAVTDCALITRKFREASGKRGAQVPGATTPEAERPPTLAERTLQLVSRADASVPSTVTAAYAAFLSLEDRDGFARAHAPETNFLALMLRHIDHVKRSALVACHMPLHLRSNEVLRGLGSGFAVDFEDYQDMLAKRVVGDQSTHHPNFVQLTRTCCICFDGQHASHACPKLQHWLHDCAKHEHPEEASTYAVPEGVPAEPPSPRPYAVRSRAAVAGWAGSGPERLLAFSKFLLSRVDAVGVLAAKSDVVAESLNLVIAKLAATGLESHAYRLYAWSPMPVIQRTTTATLLRVRNFDEAIVEQGLKAGASGSDWRLVALPPNACLMCFREGHTFHACPELQYLSASARWMQIIQSVGSFKLSNVGILAAAQAIGFDVLAGKLTTKRIRESPELGKALSKLILRCFAAGLVRHGASLMRVLPVELLTPSLHVAWWRAAEKPADAIERDLAELTPVIERFGDAVREYTSAMAAPSSGGAGSQSPAPPKPEGFVRRGGGVATTSSAQKTAAARAMRIDRAKKEMLDAQANYRRASTHGVCHRCSMGGHEAAKCSLHQTEILFGRDMLAAFRVIAMDDLNFTPEETYDTTMRFARFIAEYHKQLPYHISSVTRAANAVAALLAMMDNAPAAMRLLLLIPACFRGSHVFAHILSRYDVRLDDIERLIAQVETPADPSPDSGATERPVMNVAPIADVAVEKVFSTLPNVEAILASGEHQLAATDVTDPAQPTKLTFAQHAAMHDLNEALLERITTPLEERTKSTFGSRLGFLDVNITDEDIDLLDDPAHAPPVDVSE